MIKTIKQETFVKVSLILSTLFFASTTQSVLGMNLPLDKETKQRKLHQEKAMLTQRILQLEKEVDPLITQRMCRESGAKAMQQASQVLSGLNLLVPRFIEQKECQKQLMEALELQHVADGQQQQCLIDLEQRNQQLAQNILSLKSLHEDMESKVPLTEDLVYQLTQQDVLNLKFDYISDIIEDIYIHCQKLKHHIVRAYRSLGYVGLRNIMLAEKVHTTPGISTQKLNKLIDKVNSDVQKAARNVQMLSDLIDDLGPPSSPEQIQANEDILDEKKQELVQQVEQLSMQINNLNQKITEADKFIQGINQQLDTLDSADTTIPETLSQLAIRFADQQKALQEAVQNHSAAVTNAIIVNTGTIVSTATNGMSNVTNEKSNLSDIISSGSNICSSNNGWNIQGNIFTSKISQEENKELKKHDAGINGAFITVNKYVNENTIIGATGLYSNFNIQYDENIKHILNKTDCKTFSLSLNARYYPQHNVFSQGIIGFITYDGKTEYVTNQPSSEINGKGYYCDFMLGGHLNPAKHNLKLTLSPIVGIRYNKFNNSSHKLFDGTNVSDADHHMLEGRVGGTIKYVIDNKNILIVPEVYAFIHSNLYTNSSDIKLEYTASSDSDTVDIKAAKIHTLFGQLGGTVTIYRSQIGFGASYSAYFAEKYIAHVGSLNIKANF